MKVGSYICSRPPLDNDQRIPIEVMAINDERVLYEYTFQGGRKVGCIPRASFDRNYEPINRLIS